MLRALDGRSVRIALMTAIGCISVTGCRATLDLLERLAYSRDELAARLPGLRAGEKLHETLFHADERYRPTSHPKILQAETRAVPGEATFEALRVLREATARYDVDALFKQLRAAVPEFSPAPAVHAAPAGSRARRARPTC